MSIETVAVHRTEHHYWYQKPEPRRPPKGRERIILQMTSRSFNDMFIQSRGIYATFGLVALAHPGRLASQLTLKNQTKHLPTQEEEGQF
jgi:hypothetical protein